MYEIFFFIGLVFVFLYSKNGIDDVKGKIDRLRSKAGGSVVEEAAADENPAVAQEFPPLQVSQGFPAVAMEQKPEQKDETEKRPDENLEFKIGSKVFTAVGVVAVICAVGFFLRYAFENNLINEFGRVALGVAAGLVLLAIGEFTRKRFPNYGQALTGGGLGVLYLSFYAAFSFYRLIDQPAAFFAMVVVTAAGIFLSLRQNSMALAIFAQIGGFLTPLLINSGNGSPHIIFLYVALLDVAVFLIAFYKLWQPLSAISLAGTALAYLYWYNNFYLPEQFTPALGYLSLFFAIFLCVPFIQYFIKRARQNSWDMSLISANPIFYFAMSYALINPLYPDFMGWFAIVLGAMYCAMAAAVGGRNERDSLFRHFLLTIGFVLLAIAVPIQFHGRWIVAAWAAEALAFIVTGFKMKFSAYRMLGHGLFALTLIRILFFEGDLPANAMPLFNVRLLSYAIFFAAVTVAAYVYRRKKGELGDDEKAMFSVLALEGAFAGLTSLTLEINDSFGGYWYSIIWATGGLAAGLLSFKIKSVALRCVTYATFIAAFFRLLAFDSNVDIASYVPLFNTRVLAFVSTAVFARLFLALFRENKDKISRDEYQLFQPVLFMTFHFLLLWITSAEIISYCDRQIVDISKAFDYENLKNVLLSSAWTVYGVGLMAAGIIKKTTYERFLAIALFAIVIVKVFLVDTANLGNLYRFFSFIVLGCFLLLVGYLYYRYQDRLRKFVKGE
jgi:uncharacterized membrane protein